jgi:cobyrinic acid a,c-diamide synthase
MIKIPRLMIAAVRSGSGKTSVATGLMGALAVDGFVVQGFKVGPDFIDPSYHSAMTGRPSRNLDTWMLSYHQVHRFFRQAAADADMAVIEGVMGLFDGLQGSSEQASSAEVAKLLGCPVILVLDVHAQARSAVVEYLGCQALDPDLNLAGVILNRVQGESHTQMLQDSFRQAGNIPVLGAIVADSLPHFSERHLGLIPIPERRQAGPELQSLAAAVARQVDLPAIIEVARSAPENYRANLNERFCSGQRRLTEWDFPPVLRLAERPVRVACAWDEAFNFYYRDGLDLLSDCGVELVPFSPLHDSRLPSNVAGVLIGGGFPELFASELAENEKMKESLRQAHALGMPIYAECGGFMYLCRMMRDLEGGEHQMTGLVPGACLMEKHLIGMGYITAQARQDNILCQTGEVLRGHQFHYSTFVPDASDFPWAFSFIKGERAPWPDGYVEGNLLASYLHFHFASRPLAAMRLAESCRDFTEQH